MYIDVNLFKYKNHSNKKNMYFSIDRFIINAYSSLSKPIILLIIVWMIWIIIQIASFFLLSSCNDYIKKNNLLNTHYRFYNIKTNKCEIENKKR